MSQASIRKQLNNANKIVARQLGKRYTVYRAPSITNVLHPDNAVGTVYAAFSVDENFSNRKHVETFQEYVCFADMDKVFPGDILNDGCNTYTIVWNEGLDNVIAHRADILFEIHRASRGDTPGDYNPSLEVYAKNVPASMTAVGSSADYTLPFAQNTAQAEAYEIRIWTSCEPITPKDILVRPTDGAQFQALSVKMGNHSQTILAKKV